MTAGKGAPSHFLNQVDNLHYAYVPRLNREMWKNLKEYLNLRECVI